MSDKANNNLKSAYSFIEDVEHYIERAKSHAVDKGLIMKIEQCMKAALDLKWKLHDIIKFSNNQNNKTNKEEQL